MECFLSTQVLPPVRHDAYRLAKTVKGLHMFEIGTVLKFRYPRHNFNGVVSKTEDRAVRVKEVRSLEDRPLKRITVEIQPLLHRGMTLIIGEDCDKHEERSFYLESMTNIRSA